MSAADEKAQRLARGSRLKAAREVVGIRSAKALAEELGAGFSRTKLARIESGARSLSPQDADFIAKHLGLPTSFFTAPLERLGDVRGDDAEVTR